MRKFISLFSGAGGLDLGLELAGWDCIFATDNDPSAIATLLENRGHGLGQCRKFLERTIVELADVRQLDGAELLLRLGLQKGEVPLLAGGPPCQSWSSGGLQKGFDDPRGKLVEHYLRLAGEIEPRFLLFENVRGLLTARGKDGTPGSALELVRTRLFERGWQSKVRLVNAADFGLPQRRIRLILIGYRQGDEPGFPETTHSDTGRAGRPLWKSLSDCLAEIARPSPDEVILPSGKMAKDLEGLPPGTGAKSPGKKEATRPGGHWGYKQGAFIADLARPGRTVTASSQQDWIYDPQLGLRRLSPRECAALQSFPSNWKFVGNRSDEYRLIGNAVPPMLGEALGIALAQALAGPQFKTTSSPALAPLPPELQSAIVYTMREERRNGESRRMAGSARPRARTLAAN